MCVYIIELYSQFDTKEYKCLKFALSRFIERNLSKAQTIIKRMQLKYFESKISNHQIFHASLSSNLYFKH